MMLKPSKHLSILFLISAVFLCILIIPVKSQNIGVRLALRSVAKKKTARRTTNRKKRRRPARRSSSGKRTVVVKTREVVRRVSVKTSNLTVSSEPGARVSLKGTTRSARPLIKRVPTRNPEDRTIEFENLRPGRYTVTVSLKGFETQETSVLVPRQKTIGISMDLEPIKYNLIIETNVTEGEVRYAPAKLVGTNRDGSIKTEETGGYCIVPIEDGEANITQLEQGYYNIDVRPKEVEYEPILTAINVPTEILDEAPDSDELKSYAIDLEKKISTETFSSSWAQTDWNLPSGWSLRNRKMTTSGLTGLALPRNEQYRNYTDFELISDVISTDGNSIGFALRAVNPQNYYLLQISGANSTDKFLASGFVVKDGISKPLFTVPIEHFAKTIERKKPFRVIIKGVGNQFNIFIEDSETARKLAVGNMIDRDESFKKGAIGIAGISNSKFEVGTFTVCAKSCL